MNNVSTPDMLDQRFIVGNYGIPTIIFSVAVIFLVSHFFRKNQKEVNKPPVKPKFLSTQQTLEDVVSVSKDFNWKEVAPFKPYHFKNGEYRLTMGIKSIDFNDWLLVEPTYLSRIENKKKIVHNSHPDYPEGKDLTSSTVFITEEACPAIYELYLYIMDYICKKYPMCFKKEGDKIHNLITNKYIPADVSDEEDARNYLFYLAETIEEDFIILLKDPTREHEKDGTEYFFKAGVFAFAAGFNPRDRFNKPLSFVHHPIPGYENKLKVSMNRFFERIKPGQFVNRNNFSMQTHNKLFTDDSNKGHNLPKDHVQEELRYEDLDFDNQVHFRSERQTLTRLPKSGAIVFTIRTYLFPLSQVKNEGKDVCDRLAGAIKGFPEEIAIYKRSKEWGPAVVQYLQQP